MSIAPLALAALLARAAPAEVPPPAGGDASKPAAETPAAAPGAPLGAPPAPATGEVPELAFDRSQLANGLELLVHSDPRTPVVCVDLWYHVGAYDEERGRAGFAHLFEHLMFQGSKHNPGDGHFKLLEAAGASDVNGTTHFDYTNYYACVPNNELELLLWLEADRMAWMMDVVDQTKLDEQRGVVKNERRQDVDNVPYGAAKEALWQAMFPADHPYRGMVIGNMKDLDAASLNDVNAFFDRYYAPANATLMISGDIAVADAKKLTDKYFKSFPKWERPSRRVVTMPSLGAELRLDLEDRLAQLPLVVMAFFVPPAFQNGSADIEVLAHLLGDGQASRLHQALVVDGRLAQSVSAEYVPAANVGLLWIEAVVRPEANPEDLVNGIQAQLDLLKDLPPSPEELERTVTTFEARLVRSLQWPLGRAELLQSYNHFTGDPGFLARDLARYRAVTPDTTLAAVNGFLARERRAVAVIKPAAPASAVAAPAEAAPAAAAPPSPPPPAPPPAGAPAKEGG